jgi:hypothetical protein
VLRRSQGFLETADPERFGKRHVAASNQEIELVAQVFQVVVHRGSREEKHLSSNTGLNDFVHKPLVAASSDEISGFVALARSVVAEVFTIDCYGVDLSSVRCFGPPGSC